MPVESCLVWIRDIIDCRQRREGGLSSLSTIYCTSDKARSLRLLKKLAAVANRYSLFFFSAFFFASSFCLRSSFRGRILVRHPAASKRDNPMAASSARIIELFRKSFPAHDKRSLARIWSPSKKTDWSEGKPQNPPTSFRCAKRSDNYEPAYLFLRDNPLSYNMLHRTNRYCLLGVESAGSGHGLSPHSSSPRKVFP